MDVKKATVLVESPYTRHWQAIWPLPGNSRSANERKNNKLLRHTWTSPLKLAYHGMFGPVSRKGQRRPFNPDDEWAGLTGHLSLALSLFHLFLGFFWNPAPFFPSLLQPPTPHHPSQLQTSLRFLWQWGGFHPGDWFIDTSARQNTLNSQWRQKRLWHRDKTETACIPAGLPVKCSFYVSLCLSTSCTASWRHFRRSFKLPFN